MLKSQFLIGAASSGSGKTTLTIGLLRALRNRGLQVQPFKCGPDYLDTKHHAAAAGRESFNLDAFMSSFGHIREIYARQAASAEVCVTEGVMGLFDGYRNMEGSSAEIAHALGLPVILIINARSAAYTVAAILYGFKHFRPEIRISGIIFNFTASESHYQYLKQACEEVGIEALGYLPKDQNIEIPSRHLGLNIDSGFCFGQFADRVAALVEKTVNIDRLLEICTPSSSTVLSATATDSPKPQNTLKIAVACDEAFNFIYPENLRILEKQGKIIYFSPLTDRILPSADFIYLPGGYPELYLKPLSHNTDMRNSMLHYCQQGGRLLAECGGMMYLSKSITDTEGTKYPMCGFLPFEATMENMKLRLGYRKILIHNQEYRGHEFHYSHITPPPIPLPSIAKVFTAQNRPVDTPIYQIGHTIASYIHFYWADNGVIPFFKSIAPAEMLPPTSTV